MTSHNSEFGSWIGDNFGDDATVISLTEIHVDMSKGLMELLKKDVNVLRQWVSQYIADTLARRSTQREKLRAHVNAILEILNEGNRSSRAKATEKGMEIGEFMKGVPPALFIHSYSKVLLYALNCDRDAMVKATEDANITFQEMLVWGEEEAETEGDYLKMANTLKAIYQSNGRLLEEMDALDMFTRKTTKRLAPRAEDKEREVNITLSGTELCFPLSVMRVYDTVFLDDDEDISKFTAHDAKRVVITDEARGRGWVKVADWADDLVSKTGGLETPFTPKSIENYVVS